MLAAGVVAAAVRLRGLGRHSFVGGVGVVGVALLVLALEPMRQTTVSAIEVERARPPQPAPGPPAAPAPPPAPPVMRRVPIPTTTTTTTTPLDRNHD